MRKAVPFEQPNPRFYTEYGSGLQPDAFDLYVYLLLLTGKGLVFLSGCAHPGILNMLHTAASRSGAPLYAVIGGTHLVEAGEARLQKTAAGFRKLGLSPDRSLPLYRSRGRKPASKYFSLSVYPE